MLYLKSIIADETPGPRSYLNDIPAVRHLFEKGSLKFKKPVTILVGENGTGKSTLLEAIAVKMGFNPEGGSREHSFVTHDSHSELCDLITCEKIGLPKDGFFLRAESFYNTASYLEENSTMIRYGGISFHHLSHGESFLSLVKNRFEGKGLYLLDEPEAALSPSAVMSLLVCMDELVKNDSQFIISTHSPILMSFPDADIWELSDKGIARVAYKETQHYKITKRFIDDPESMLRMLLGE